MFDPFGPHASISNPEWFYENGEPREVRDDLHDRLVGEVPCRVDGACLFVADRVGVSPRLVARGVTVDGRMMLTEVPAAGWAPVGPRLTPKAEVLASARGSGPVSRMGPGAALQGRPSRPGGPHPSKSPRGVER